MTPAGLLAARAAVAALALATAGCRATGIQVSDGFAAGATAVPHEFSVVVWNAEKGKDPALPDEISNFARDGLADIVMTQESVEDLPPSPGLGSVFAPSFRVPLPGGETVGKRTYSRLQPVAADRFATRLREFWITVPKVTLATEMRLADGRRLLLLNIHSINFERFLTFKYRSQLAGLGEAIRAHEGPVVFAGDFNTWSSRRLAALRDFTRSAGLVEVDSFPPGRTTGDTGTRFFNRLLGIDPELPLDRVFVRGLDVLAAEVLPPGASDHRPIRVALRASGG